MTEFDEWWKKYTSDGICDYEECYEAGWKAALEMALKSSQCSGDNADVFWDTGNKRYVKVGCNTRGIIRKELEA